MKNSSSVYYDFVSDKPAFVKRLAQHIGKDKTPVQTVARATGTSSTMVYNWLHGSEPSMSNAVNLCRALHCDIDYLCGLQNYPSSSTNQFANETGLSPAAVQTLKKIIAIDHDAAEHILTDGAPDLETIASSFHALSFTQKQMTAYEKRRDSAAAELSVLSEQCQRDSDFSRDSGNNKKILANGNSQFMANYDRTYLHYAQQYVHFQNIIASFTGLLNRLFPIKPYKPTDYAPDDD